MTFRGPKRPGTWDGMTHVERADLTKQARSAVAAARTSKAKKDPERAALLEARKAEVEAHAASLRDAGLVPVDLTTAQIAQAIGLEARREVYKLRQGLGPAEPVKGWFIPGWAELLLKAGPSTGTAERAEWNIFLATLVKDDQKRMLYESLWRLGGQRDVLAQARLEFSGEAAPAVESDSGLIASVSHYRGTKRLSFAAMSFQMAEADDEEDDEDD